MNNTERFALLLILFCSILAAGFTFLVLIEMTR